MQRFSGFRLDQETNVKPPDEWATGDGTQPMEKVHPVSHLTMYVKARIIFVLCAAGVDNFIQQGGLWVYMNPSS